ncbi:MAG: hypothetical protein ABSD74_07315 [Rhizomicrobium sp.]|jgi:hypothetical protein
MWRTVGGVVAGLVAWLVVVSLIDRGLKLGIPGYAAAEPVMQFTLAMKIARLTMAAVTSLIAGMVVGAVAPSSRWAPWITGFVTLAIFLPGHIFVFWYKFPVWYHLSFLVPLVPLVVIGAAVWPKRRSPAAAA